MQLGCDPEFELTKNGTLVFADRVFEDHNRTRALGLDGSSATAELRTRPGNPQHIMNSLNRSIAKAVKVCDSYQLGIDAFAGSGTHVPLGGHIHFSDVRRESALVRALDNLVSIPLNEVSDTHKRKHHGYGFLGDSRSNRHGWEYRSAPSWLSHPVIAKGVLEIAWFLAQFNWYSYQEYKGEHFDVNTLDKLLALMPEGENKENVQVFVRTLETMQADYTTLESLEIFRAWGKKEFQNGVVSYPQVMFHESFRTPENKPLLDVVCAELLLLWQKEMNSAIFSKENITFAPARASRAENYVLFFPTGYLFPSQLEFYEESGIYNVLEMKEWELPFFGLSSAARKLLPELIARVIWSVQQIVSNNPAGAQLSARLVNLEKKVGIKAKHKGGK